MIQLTDHGPDPPFQLTGRLFSAMIGSGKQKAIFSWIPPSVLSAAKGRRVQINKALRHNVRKGCLFIDDYNMGRDEKILLGAPLDAVECGKSGKPAAIAREIGKRPVLAFGNSSGDYSMLNYAEGNPDHPGMGVFIVCDDTVREYGSDEKAAEFYSIAEKEGWTPVSMANDWKTIYGEDVRKTELPGAGEESLPDAA